MAKARVLFKTDTVSNWEEVEETFSPLKGELCIYSDISETNRVNSKGNKIYNSGIKIGLGNNIKLKSLPFLQEDYITEAQIRALGNSFSALGSFTLGKSALA